MKSSKSFILFWNYEDLHAIDPLLILTSPLEVLTFEFNPKDPNFVVAGTINGQIMMWDLKNVQIGQSTKKKGGKSEKNAIREIAPSLMSALQDPTNITPVTDQIKRNIPSHKSPVACLKWFPSGLEIEMRKSYSALVQNAGGEINQFATISTDGQVLLWEKKFLDAQKKVISDVFPVLFSTRRLIGRRDMDFICFGRRVEVPWEDRTLLSIKTRSGLCLRGRLTRGSCSFAIGRRVQLMRLEARTTR
jgi:WD40 repeat protein